MRTVAITGAASGLGKALRARLEADGARVIGVDIAGCEISADLSAPGGRVAAIAGLRSACGGVLDALVPCAGLGPQHPGERIVAFNYFGAIATLDGLVDELAAAAEERRRSDSGRASASERPDAPGGASAVSGGAAVMISSNSTTMTPGASGPIAEACLDDDEDGAQLLARDAHPAVAYAASKVAIGKAVRRRAQSFGERGVRLNAVAPGAFLTPLLQQGLDDPETGDLIRGLPIPLGRFGEPDDIADVIVWLLSDGARYVHGSTLFADGGTDALLSPDRFP
jgi:NAD(P)-dependent dehydrogenase (short-subunit alcohol dehydrogenase family)